jgi:hypothetical protein
MGNSIFVHYEIVSAVKGVEFVKDRMSYTVQRDRWCNINVFNTVILSEGKSDDSKDSFYEEKEQFFEHFPKYHMKILLGDFNARGEKENAFKPTVGNASILLDNNDSDVRIKNFVTLKKSGY